MTLIRMSTGIDYLAIGHVSRDESPEGSRLGGAVTFATLTAHAFGLRAAMITSVPPDDALLNALVDIPKLVVHSPHFTTFENRYTAQGSRTQILLNHAARLEISAARHLPEDWQAARIVHLAPVADEVNPRFMDVFPGALIGVTPQGWLRQWDEQGDVRFRQWDGIFGVIALAGAVVLSIEDVAGDEGLVRQYARLSRIVVVTRGEQGCTLHVAGQEPQNIPAPVVDVVDPTGAGDIFAASFFIVLHQRGDPVQAAQIATRLASASVTRIGLQGVPHPSEIDAALRSAPLT